MKIMFDLNKSLDKTKLVQVQRTVQGKNGQYTRMQWVKPSDVKDTDKVIGGQQDSMEISEKNFPVGSKIYYKGEEATVQRVGKEFSGGGTGIVVRFSKGGTGTIGKSDMKNVSKTPPSKSYSNDAKSNSANKTLYFKNGESISYKDGKIIRTFKGGVKTEISQAEADRVIPFLTKKYGKSEAPKNDTKESIPDKALGKTWSDTKTELGKMGYKVDSIFSSQPPQPKEKLILYKDGKEYEAEVTKYHNGDYEILGSSIKEVKKDDDTKKDKSDKTDKKDLVEESDKLTAMMDQIKKQTKWTSDSKLLEAFDNAANTGDDVTEEHEVDFVQVTKVEEYKGNGPNGPGTVDRIRVTAKVTGKTSSGKTFTKEMSISTKKVGNGNSPTKSDKDSGKFSMSEFTKLKSDRTKAIQYLKDNGISWKETDNEGINWMRACMAASRAENPAQGATKKDSASKSSSDTKSSGKSTEEAKKAVKDLLSENNNDRAKVMQIAKASGVTWKESDNDGINWMRASLAIQKHHESGKTISVSASDDKKDDTKTDDKPSAKKVAISDLKRPASNNTSTNLVAGDYNISVTKLRNVGANAKQHPSFYRIVVEKDGDRVFYTDKTDWSDIKEHAKRYIDSASSSDSKSDKKSDSKPTHDNPLVTTETKSGKPYQIWESNGRIYGSLPGKQDSRNVRDIRDFTSSGFETLDEVKDYIKKYF